ncbi:MAG TPA: hypothetical protein VFI74_01625 [Candidatus Saccharimonadales bacterium]|nr:hypothetical protein [Candidatus Saccharimonadales bacterium]
MPRRSRDSKGGRARGLRRRSTDRQGVGKGSVHIDLGHVSQEPDYLAELSYQPLSESAVSLGRPLERIERTLQTIGRRAAKVGQKVAPPAERPQIAYISPKEFHRWQPMPQSDYAGFNNVYTAPFELYVEEDAVLARIPTSALNAIGDLDDWRLRRGLQPLGITEAEHHDVPLVRAPGPSITFVESINELNQFTLRLEIGRVGLLS